MGVLMRMWYLFLALAIFYLAYNIVIQQLIAERA